MHLGNLCSANAGSAHACCVDQSPGRLTGRVSTEPSDAGNFLLLDRTASHWTRLRLASPPSGGSMRTVIGTASQAIQGLALADDVLVRVLDIPEAAYECVMVNSSWLARGLLEVEPPRLEALADVAGIGERDLAVDGDLFAAVARKGRQAAPIRSQPGRDDTRDVSWMRCSVPHQQIISISGSRSITSASVTTRLAWSVSPNTLRALTICDICCTQLVAPAAMSGFGHHSQ